MITNLTVQDLLEFENLVAETYNAKGIRAPVHLSGGNEAQLIEIFQDVGVDDWVCSTWRSHYHCLLKGVPPGQLLNDICAGHSITLTYPDYRIVTSAIVGGICPIALGLAYAIREAGGNNKVWCFVGDMTASGGAFLECWKYGSRHSLPIMFVTEDNKRSVGTNTHEVWGKPRGTSNFIAYEYELPWPHAGAGKWIEF